MKKVSIFVVLGFMMLVLVGCWSNPVIEKIIDSYGVSLIDGIFDNDYAFSSIELEAGSGNEIIITLTVPDGYENIESDLWSAQSLVNNYELMTTYNLGSLRWRIVFINNDGYELAKDLSTFRLHVLTDLIEDARIELRRAERENELSELSTVEEFKTWATENDYDFDIRADVSHLSDRFLRWSIPVEYVESILGWSIVDDSRLVLVVEGTSEWMATERIEIERRDRERDRANSQREREREAERAEYEANNASYTCRNVGANSTAGFVALDGVVIGSHGGVSRDNNLTRRRVSEALRILNNNGYSCVISD